jgi:hypothetical protein
MIATTMKSVPQRLATGRAPQAMLAGLVALVLAPVLVMTRADPDLWGHVRFGLDILTQHRLPSIDPYSFTQDVPWVNHEWLSELIMGIAYTVAGPTGLSLLKGGLVAVLFVIVLSAYARVAVPVAGAAVIVLGAGTGRVITTLRPQLWTAIGVALLCRLLITQPRRWWLAAVPPMFVLWVNLHGGWIVGAGLLAMWTAFQFVRSPRSRGLVTGIAVMSALGTLVNPYGWRMWAFLGTTVRLTRPIAEWQPLTSTPVLAWIPWGIVVTVVALSLVSSRRPPLDRVAMVAMLAYAAFRVERLAPLCVISAIVLLSPTILARWPSDAAVFDPISPAAAGGVALVMIALFVGSGIAVARTARCIVMDGSWIPDRSVGRALVASNLSGRMVTFFDWGEYAIWHLSPSLRVSIDGRRETVYSDRVLEGHDAMNGATAEGIAYLQGLNPDYVWLPIASSRLRDWLAANGYRIDRQTDESFLAVRADRPTLADINMSDTRTLTACFPGP